jgi:hypothetical protein
MEEALRVWERKILRKVYGPKTDTNGWRIGTNKELQDQYRSAVIVTSIKVRRLEWADHVVRMDDEECFWETQEEEGNPEDGWIVWRMT